MSRPVRLALLALTLAAVAARLVRLLQDVDPLGTDGFYYVVQAERLLATGRLHAPDGSWVLRWLAAAVAAVGAPVAGVKWGAAILAAACVPAAAFAGARVARAVAPAADGTWAAVALAAWAAVSPTLGQLAAEFPKALGAVPPSLLLLGLAAGRPRRAGLALLLVVAAATATAHRLGASLALLGGLGALVGLAARGAGPRATATFLGVAALLVAGFTVVSLAVPNLLHTSDLDRLSGQLQPVAGWPSPFPYLALRRFTAGQVVELSLPWVALAATAPAWWRAPATRPLLGALALPLAACLVPPWRRDVLDLGYRLALMAPMLAAPLAVAVASAWAPGRPLARPGAASAWPAAAALAAALLAWPGALAGIDVEAHPPWAQYRRLVAALPRPLPDLLIAHQGLAFLYDHETGMAAMSWAPEPGLDRRRIGRIAWGVEPGEWVELAPAVPGAPIHRLGLRYAYLREDVWEAFVERARRDGDDGLLTRVGDWRNPGRTRPASLARNHPAPSDKAPP